MHAERLLAEKVRKVFESTLSVKKHIFPLISRLFKGIESSKSNVKKKEEDNSFNVSKILKGGVSNVVDTHTTYYTVLASLLNVVSSSK